MHDTESLKMYTIDSSGDNDVVKGSVSFHILKLKL
jgi:hypothetical protein